MASGRDKPEDDTYDIALQRLMKQCLPPILVDVADLRPRDPIEYMAQRLYKYREKEDEALFNTESSQSRTTPSPSLHTSDAAGQHNTAQQDKIRKSLIAKGMIVESNEDFIDTGDDFEVVNISNKMVHEPCVAVMKLIGDIFDEDDIT